MLPNFPLHFANARLTRRWEFPVLGRDTETVLRDVVGYSEERAAIKQTACWSKGECLGVTRKSKDDRSNSFPWFGGINVDFLKIGN